MNIKDIASLAGVSTATVSRVLNGTGPVKDKTKERILKIVEEYRYTPNALARGLIQNRTRTVGVLTVDILNPYYSMVTHYVEQRLRELGIMTFLCNTGDESRNREEYLQTLLENRVDGIVFVGSTFQSDLGGHIVDRAADSVPVVLINAESDHENAGSILCDDEAGVSLAYQHVRNGQGPLMFLGTDGTASGRKKIGVFRELSSADGCRSPHVVLTDDHHIDRIPDLLNGAGERGFGAVLASDDLFAHAVLKWARAVGLRVPEELRVVGYNDSQIALYAIPPLTSVNSRMDAMGIAAADHIERRIKGEISGNQRYVLEPFLTIRESAPAAPMKPCIKGE